MSGDIVLGGAVYASFDLENDTVQLNVPAIENTSTTATGPLRYEVWLTTTPWNSAGSNTGYEVANGQIQIAGDPNGILEPDSTFLATVATLPYNNPPPATYYVTLVIAEYTGTSPGVDDGYVQLASDTFSNFEVFASNGGASLGASIPAPGIEPGHLVFVEGPGSFSINTANNSVQLNVPWIENVSSNTTGSVQLELWLTATPFGTGPGYEVATYQPLSGTADLLGQDQAITNISATVSYINQPPAGTYYATLVAAEYTGVLPDVDNGFVSDSTWTFSTFSVVASNGSVSQGPSIFVAPTISAVTDTNTAYASTGHIVTITMLTSEAATVRGIPTLQLNDNEVATYTSGSGTNQARFHLYSAIQR